MKKLFFSIFTSIISFGVFGQDVDINILMQPAFLPPGGSGQIQVDICNVDARTVYPLPAYKIRPLLSVPGSIVTITGTTNLPTGWSVCSNNGSSIRVSNGLDNLMQPGECRTFFIDVTANAGVTSSQPLVITATLAFAGGAGTGTGPGAPGSACLNGPQTNGNDPANDNSTTSVGIQAVMPIKLLSFNANKTGNTGKLEWITSSETNSSHIDIEYSPNNNNWSKIGTVQAVGNSSINSKYGFVHQNGLIEGNNYYRLKLIDKDGKFYYSNIVKLQLSSIGGESVFIYPNPAMLYSTVNIQNNYRGKATILVTDMSGKTAQTLPINLNAGINTKNINISNLSNGVYVINIIAENGDKLGASQKLIVAK